MMLRQLLLTREARGREEGCGGRRRRISSRMSWFSSGGTGTGEERRRLITARAGEAFSDAT
jgi:hypothetical protein